MAMPRINHAPLSSTREQGALPVQCEPPGPGRKGLGTILFPRSGGGLEGRGQEGWVSGCLPPFLACLVPLACLVATVSR